MRIDGFAMMPNFTFGMAIATFVGQNVGANRMDRVSQGSRDMLKVFGYVIRASGLIVDIWQIPYRHVHYHGRHHQPWRKTDSHISCRLRSSGDHPGLRRHHAGRRRHHALHVDFYVLNCRNTCASCISFGMAHKEQNAPSRIA